MRFLPHADCLCFCVTIVSLALFAIGLDVMEASVSLSPEAGGLPGDAAEVNTGQMTSNCAVSKEDCYAVQAVFLCKLIIPLQYYLWGKLQVVVIVVSLLLAYYRYVIKHHSIKRRHILSCECSQYNIAQTIVAGALDAEVQYRAFSCRG
jgi:hypothetical protein